jgi:hypothetical protein
MPETLDRDGLLARRLEAQSLAGPPRVDPADVVRALGAVQAQELPRAIWAVAQRTARPDRAAVVADLDAGEILRSHALRPTWHFLARDDLRWMQAATAERVERAVGTRYRDLRLDDTALDQAAGIVVEAIRRDGPRTRPELAAELAAADIDVADPVRVQHILLHAEVTALITSGAQRDTTATYDLVDTRAPESGSVRPADPAAELARRYLAGHGPATVRDLAWWSGMTVRAAQAAVASISGELREHVVDGIEYWSTADAPDPAEPPGILLLPAFDEFFVGYADRSAATPDGFPGNPVFQNVIARRGEIVGTWDPNAEGVAPELIEPLAEDELTDLADAIERYEHYRDET